MSGEAPSPPNYNYNPEFIRESLMRNRKLCASLYIASKLGRRKIIENLSPAQTDFLIYLLHLIVGKVLSNLVFRILLPIMVNQPKAGFIPIKKKHGRFIKHKEGGFHLNSLVNENKLAGLRDSFQSEKIDFLLKVSTKEVTQAKKPSCHSFRHFR